jgi:O-glycosyl hydrolase
MRPISLVLVVLYFARIAAGAEVAGSVDGTRQFQTIEGFGTCLISWGEYPDRTYTPEFVRFYAETVGLSMLRIELNGFTHPEERDAAAISWKRIATNSRARVFTGFSRQLLEVRPDVRLIGTVWTPPEWMKLNQAEGNGTGNGGRNFAIPSNSYVINGTPSTNRVDPALYPHFVQWLVAVVAWHKEQGMPLYALSPANEPRFSQWYGSCIWTGDDLATVFALLRPALDQAGFGDVLLFGPEDMTGHLHAHGTRGMIQSIVQNPAALAALDRFATHGYTDGVQMDATAGSSAAFWKLVEAHGKPCWMTEGGTGDHAWPAPVRSGLGIALHNALVAGNASAFLPWQIAESRPSTHAIAVGGEVTPKTAAGMHFFRTIRPGARRIAAEPAFGQVPVSAFRHPVTGGLSVIVLNPGDEAAALRLKLQDVGAPARLHLRRTSATELFADLGSLPVEPDGTVRLDLPAASIVSLTSGH